MIAEPKIFVPIPTGSYPAKIQEVETTEGQYGPQWRWTFNLGNVEDVDGNIDEKTLTYYTPNYITPNNKLGKMLLSLGLPVDQPFDSTTIIGRTVTLSVVEAPRKDNTIGNNIEAVLPPRRRRANGTAGDDAPASGKKDETAAGDEDGDDVPW